jgi:hypothetical protein
VREQLEISRIQVYRTFFRPGFLRGKLRREIKLNEQVQAKMMFLSRLKLELQDAKSWMKYETQALLDVFSAAVQPNEKPLNLASAFEMSLNFHLDKVEKHLDLLAKFFTEYISRRHLAVMYRLQLQVLLLTLLATLIAIFGVMGKPTPFRHFFFRN